MTLPIKKQNHLCSANPLHLMFDNRPMQQILDGYEDRERYQNMQSLGMEKEQIKKNVRSQLALTFFLPLLGAGIHLIFSFRLMNQLLRAAGLVNTTLLMQEMISSFLFFLLIYILIYQVVDRIKKELLLQAIKH